MTPTRPSTRSVVSAVAVFFLAYLSFLLVGRSHGAAVLKIDDLILLAVSLPPLVFSILAARSTRGRLRSAWQALAAGLIFWNLAELIWTVDKFIVHKSPVPSPADAFFLLWPLAACVALLRFWDRGPRQSYARILLDGFIVGGSLFLVSWVLNMSDVYQAGAASKTEFIIAMAYPVADWILVTVAAIVLVNIQAGLRLVLTLMTVGLLAMAVNSSGYAYLSALLGYSSAAVVNIGWVAGLLLLTVAAAIGRGKSEAQESATDHPGWASVWLPFAPLMVAAAVLAYGPQEIVSTLLVEILGALLVVAVLARQFLAVRENRELLAMVSEQAQRDPLTGLVNRTLFAERLAGALRRREQTGNAVAVLSLDLDNFKMINDTLGHAAGDEMLKRVGERIVAAVPAGATAARVGGDEFAVMVEGDADLAGEVADRILEVFLTPVVLFGLEMPMRPSIGRAMAGADQPATTADDLLLQADMSMYSAKRSLSAAPGPVAVAQPVHLLRELRRAVDDGDLTLVYQPEFDLRGGAMVGVEALLRWPHPDLGVLEPDQFLSLVRHHGLIEPVTDLVIESALDDVRKWHAAGVVVPVAVNIFPPSLVTLPDRLDRALSRRGLAGSALTVEITEDFLVDDAERTRRILAELRARGIRVAVDDFGTGYTALQYLRDLPLDEVKLDRSIIDPVCVDPRAAAVARAVIELGHALGVIIVAEGVESADTACWLRNNGCDVGQGFFFCVPRAADEILGVAESAAGRPG